MWFLRGYIGFTHLRVVWGSTEVIGNCCWDDIQSDQPQLVAGISILEFIGNTTRKLNS